MDYLEPQTWQEALEIKAAHPEAVPLQGGTDLLVDLNFGRIRPSLILGLGRIPELQDCREAGDQQVLGAGVTYADVIRGLGSRLAGLASASRTIGSTQIRNRGTVGGNLGSASPAGDAHPALIASRAAVEVGSVRGPRTIPIDEFFVGPGENALAADELIATVRVPCNPDPGGEQFAKVGSRNAMVIAACSFALSVDRPNRRVGAGIGSAGPTPLRAREAEQFLQGALDEGDGWNAGTPLTESVRCRFGELVAEAASPIDDVRATARYRRHALTVLARRTLIWIQSRREGAGL